MEPVIDLEEAVGSYLNCLSTGCAAGSKLYTSVGKIIDEKFHEIFHDQEPRDKYLKSSFQLLQTQNAFEGYQQALLECKEKLLEILIDSHTKRHQPNKNKQDGSTEEVCLLYHFTLNFMRSLKFVCFVLGFYNFIV